MKKILLIISAVILISCQEKPKPHPIEQDMELLGKSYRSLKDSFKKGYNNTTTITNAYK